MIKEIIAFGNSYFARGWNSRYDGLFIKGYKTIHYLGIKNKKNPAHFVEYKTYGGNIIKDDPMPKNIYEALKLFENSSVLKKYLGSDYVKLYTNVKRGEEMHLQNSFIPAEEYDFYL